MHLRKRFLFYSFLLLAFVMATMIGYIMGQQDLLTKSSAAMYFDGNGKLKVAPDVMQKAPEMPMEVDDLVIGVITDASLASDGSTVIMVEGKGPGTAMNENDVVTMDSKDSSDEAETKEASDAATIYKLSVTSNTQIFELGVMTARKYPTMDNVPEIQLPEKLSAADLKAGMMVHVRKNKNDVATSISILPMEVTTVTSNDDTKQKEEEAQTQESGTSSSGSSGTTSNEETTTSGQ